MRTAEEIMASYPTLFPEPPRCGFECPPGWLGLVDELCKKLEPLARKYEGPEKPRVDQVKEKFGSLRVYLSHYTDEMQTLEEEAVMQSAITCQRCGASAELRQRGRWLITLCEGCNQ